jgi:hypothetical protein
MQLERFLVESRPKPAFAGSSQVYSSTRPPDLGRQSRGGLQPCVGGFLYLQNPETK